MSSTPGDRGRHLVAEIGVLGPLDGALDDALHDRGGARNRYLLGIRVVVLPLAGRADPPGVQHEGLDLIFGPGNSLAAGVG